MTKKSIGLRLAALRPRNPFFVLARKRSAGKHSGPKRQKSSEEKDFVQRLREAGL